MRISISILLFLFSYTYSFGGEKDTTLYNTYRDQVVLYNYLGFHSAPFSIKDEFNLGVKRIQYKHNLRPILGFGIAYKWFKLRFGIGLPKDLRSSKKFGKSQYTTLGLSLNTKKIFWNGDLKVYSGYVNSDAYKWNSNFTKDTSYFRPDINTFLFSIDAWNFRTKKYRMPATVSAINEVKSSSGSIFYKYSFSVFGVGSNDSLAIIPTELINTNQTVSSAYQATSINFAFTPGYSYIYKYKNFRIAGVAGVGLALQSRFFRTDPNVEQKNITGLAPRLDFRLLTGYSVDKYFIVLVSSFEYQNIVYRELKYNQRMFSVYIVGGYRFNKKDKSKRKD